MADVVARAGRLRLELQGAARAAQLIDLNTGAPISQADVARELGKLRREMEQGGRMEYRRQYL